VRSEARRNQLNLPHGTKTKPDMLKNGEQPESVVQWRKPGLQFGERKKNLPSPKFRNFRN